MEDIFPKRWAGATEGKGQRGVFQRPGLWEIDTCCWGRISVWFLVEMTWAVGRWDRELFPVLRYPGLSITVYWVHDSDSILPFSLTGPHRTTRIPFMSFCSGEPDWLVLSGKEVACICVKSGCIWRHIYGAMGECGYWVGEGGGLYSIDCFCNSASTHSSDKITPPNVVWLASWSCPHIQGWALILISQSAYLIL